MRKTILLAALAAVWTMVAQAGPLIIADTNADYSGIQGANSWSYGYFQYPGRTFTQTGFTYGDSFSGWWALGTSGTTTFGFEGPNSKVHPGLLLGLDGNPTTRYDVVREYSNTFAGAVTISGSFSKVDSAPAGRALVGSIYKNGSILFSQTLAGDDTAGFSYNLATTLTPGDVLDFAVSAGNAPTVENDLVVFSGTIATVTTPTPEPGTLMLGVSLLGLPYLLRRRQAKA